MVDEADKSAKPFMRAWRLRAVGVFLCEVRMLALGSLFWSSPSEVSKEVLLNAHPLKTYTVLYAGEMLENIVDLVPEPVSGGHI